MFWTRLQAKSYLYEKIFSSCSAVARSSQPLALYARTVSFLSGLTGWNCSLKKLVIAVVASSKLIKVVAYVLTVTRSTRHKKRFLSPTRHWALPSKMINNEIYVIAKHFNILLFKRNRIQTKTRLPSSRTRLQAKSYSHHVTV